MALNEALKNTTVLSQHVSQSPQEVERRKSSQEKAEDVVYTLNHSITCLGVTDTFGLVGAANLYNKIFGTKHDLGHDHNTGYGGIDWAWDRIRGKHNDKEYVHKIYHEEDKRLHDHDHHHDHDHGHAHDHHHHDHGHKHDHGHAHHHDHGHTHAHAHEIHPDPAPKLTPASSGSEAASKLWGTTKKWLFAEAVGDLGSVPFTIALQRWAPGFMQGVRNVIEPIISKPFHKTSDRDAKNWGLAHGKDPDSPEVKQRAAELYEYEMKHMPQMAVWTVSSIGLNFAAMHVFHKFDPRQYERTSLKEFAQVKGLGALFTAGLVLGVRGLTPGGAHKWDRTAGKYVVAPLTKTVGRLVGINPDDVDRFQKQRENQTSGHHHDFGLTEAITTKGEEKPVEVKTEVKVEVKTEPKTEPKTTVESGTTQHTPPTPHLEAPVMAVGM